MTREEIEIRNAIDTIFPISHSGNGRTYEQALMASGFEEGIKWADDNPKSPWISVKDDLPCNHKELTDWECDTTNVIVTGLTNTGGRFRYLDHMTKNGNALGRWRWSLPYGEYKISYWMPFPKLPNM